MFGHYYVPPHRGWAHHRHGRWERRRGPGILPFLAAGFMVAKALQRRERGERHWGGPWAGEKWHGPHGGPGFEQPWWRGHRHGRGGWPGWGLRSEIGPIVGMLRDAYRRGSLDETKVSQIRDVIRDSRKRIAAILGETPTSYTEL